MFLWVRGHPNNIPLRESILVASIGLGLKILLLVFE